jgi:uncharacterized glyoxalase superfamily protein PhnB
MQLVTPYLLYEDGEQAAEFLRRDPQGHKWSFAQVLERP